MNKSKSRQVNDGIVIFPFSAHLEHSQCFVKFFAFGSVSLNLFIAWHFYGCLFTTASYHWKFGFCLRYTDILSYHSTMHILRLLIHMISGLRIHAQCSVLTAHIFRHLNANQINHLLYRQHTLLRCRYISI